MGRSGDATGVDRLDTLGHATIRDKSDGPAIVSVIAARGICLYFFVSYSTLRYTVVVGKIVCAC
jgi:hypothetical protein